MSLVDGIIHIRTSSDGLLITRLENHLVFKSCDIEYIPVFFPRTARESVYEGSKFPLSTYRPWRVKNFQSRIGGTVTPLL